MWMGCANPRSPLWGTLEGCLREGGTAPGTQQPESAGDVEVLPDLVSGRGSVGTHGSQSAKRDNGMGCGRISARKSR